MIYAHNNKIIIVKDKLNEAAGSKYYIKLYPMPEQMPDYYRTITVRLV